jgi:tetratricopeptide (TPR) repeat protein
MQHLQSVAKASGDSLAGSGQWEEALEHYFSAMEVRWQRSPGEHSELGTLHSNCSLCCLKLGRDIEALEHAEAAVRMCPQWAKAHGRRGAALEAAGRLADAGDAYRTAEAHAAAHGEAAEFTAGRSRVEGSGDDGRLHFTPRPPAQHGDLEAARAEAARSEEARIVEVDEPRIVEVDEPRIVEVKAADNASDGSHDSDDDGMGEPLGAPVAFEPARACVTLREANA